MEAYEPPFLFSLKYNCLKISLSYLNLLPLYDDYLNNNLENLFKL